RVRGRVHQCIGRPRRARRIARNGVERDRDRGRSTPRPPPQRAHLNQAQAALPTATTQSAPSLPGGAGLGNAFTGVPEPTAVASAAASWSRPVLQYTTLPVSVWPDQSLGCNWFVYCASLRFSDIVRAAPCGAPLFSTSTESSAGGFPAPLSRGGGGGG